MSRQLAQTRTYGPPEDEDGERLPRGCFSRALVVDDDHHVRDLLCRMLRRWGIAARGARDVFDARSELLSVPELLLVDVYLPDGSGVTVAREAAALSPRPVVVGISGNASPDKTFELGCAGVRAFLVKPFSEHELSVAVRTALIEHEIEELRAGRPRPLSEPTRTVLAGALDGYCAHHGLTRRQRQMVGKIVEGVPRGRLATALGVTENTCKSDIRRMLMRCGLARTTGIPAAVLEHSRSQPSVDTGRVSETRPVKS